jgi:hypothetical protein
MKFTVDLDPQYNYMIEKFARFICKEYSILPRHILITEYALEGSNGMCIDDDLERGTFIILVNYDRDLSQVFTTVAHEMIHVKQYMTQNLGYHLDKYKDTEYGDSWWEREAFENAVPLVEKFAKNL